MEKFSYTEGQTMTNNRGLYGALALVIALLAFVSATPFALAGPPTPTQSPKPASQPVKPDRPDSPNAAYLLYGDATNSGHTGTYFTTDDTANNGYGWYFGNSNSAEAAVYAVGGKYGVYGNGNYYGVYGSGDPYGVYGYSNDYGVDGEGGLYGVYGYSRSGTGVYGQGSQYGMYGNATQYGVFGMGNTSGVVGQSSTSSGAGYGVRGFTTSSSNASAGGYFTATAGVGIYGGSNSLYGVYGVSTSNAGVYGISSSSIGVFGRSTSNSYGVAGLSNANAGLYGSSTTGPGVFANTDKGTIALRAVNKNKTSGHYAGYFDGNIYISGSFVATGTKSAAVYTDQGPRLMYAEESTQNYFSDQGTAQLKNGAAVIQIDALFAQTVNLSGVYQVFVTPRSATSAGLAVINQGPTSFEVRELNKGVGNYSFDWRITALRKGYENTRMDQAPAAVQLPSDQVPTIPKDIAAP